MCHSGSTSGWISAYNPNPLLNIGVIDFAGSGVVHTLGGFSALCAAVLLGPRMGRFDPMTDQRTFTVAPNPSLYLLGSLMLWFGWWVVDVDPDLGVLILIWES